MLILLAYFCTPSRLHQASFRGAWSISKISQEKHLLSVFWIIWNCFNVFIFTTTILQLFHLHLHSHRHIFSFGFSQTNAANPFLTNVPHQICIVQPFTPPRPPLLINLLLAWISVRPSTSNTLTADRPLIDLTSTQQTCLPNFQRRKR